MVKHIVLMKIKPDFSAAEIDELMTALAGLTDKIDGLIDFTGGADITDGSRSMGFTHGFVMTMRDPEAAQAYQPHPEHRKVAARVREMSESVLSFDYEY